MLLHCYIAMLLNMIATLIHCNIATMHCKGVNTGLNAYFFGEDLKGELTVERFLEFQRSLQEEILALEFKKKDEDGKGKIAEKDFADLLIAYAGFQPKKKARMLRRVR